MVAKQSLHLIFLSLVWVFSFKMLEYRFKNELFDPLVFNATFSQHQVSLLVKSFWKNWAIPLVETFVFAGSNYSFGEANSSLPKLKGHVPILDFFLDMFRKNRTEPETLPLKNNSIKTFWILERNKVRVKVTQSFQVSDFWSQFASKKFKVVLFLACSKTIIWGVLFPIRSYPAGSLVFQLLQDDGKGWCAQFWK